MKNEKRGLVDQILKECRKRFIKGSKSFSLAANFFPSELLEATLQLYAWCRYCDDKIDQTPSPKKALLQLKYIQKKTSAALKGHLNKNLPFLAFQKIVQKYKIPHWYPLEFLRGMKMDVEQQQYENWNQLSLYCYRVAGVVGAMMVYLMGVKNHLALLHAVALGIAMQLTNIARDIWEDWKKGKIYLPLEWLLEKGIRIEELTHLKNRNSLFQVLTRLLDLADHYYALGRKGLKYLSFRCALGVNIAAYIYAEIGHQIRLKGISDLEKRVIISLGRKWILCIKGFFSTLWMSFQFWKRHSPNPWEASYFLRNENLYFFSEKLFL